jgi:hypothetical protein
LEWILLALQDRENWWASLKVLMNVRVPQKHCMQERDKVSVKVKFSLYVTKHHNMKTYGGVEV